MSNVTFDGRCVRCGRRVQTSSGCLQCFGSVTYWPVRHDGIDATVFGPDYEPVRALPTAGKEAKP